MQRPGLSSFATLAPLAAVLVAAFFAACSSSSTPPGTSNNDSGTSGTNDGSGGGGGDGSGPDGSSSNNDSGGGAGQDASQDAPRETTTLEAGSWGILPTSCVRTDVSLANDVVPILTANCSDAESCHGENVTTAANAHAYFVNVDVDDCGGGVVRVKPGDPLHSHIIDKLTGRNLCGDGEPMPKGASSPLSPSDIQTIYDWICSGALEN